MAPEHAKFEKADAENSKPASNKRNFLATLKELIGIVSQLVSCGSKIDKTYNDIQAAQQQPPQQVCLGATYTCTTDADLLRRKTSKLIYQCLGCYCYRISSTVVFMDNFYLTLVFWTLFCLFAMITFD